MVRKARRRDCFTLAFRNLKNVAFLARNIIVTNMMYGTFAATREPAGPVCKPMPTWQVSHLIPVPADISKVVIRGVGLEEDGGRRGGHF